jgi:excisionase family DNA binding protein
MLKNAGDLGGEDVEPLVMRLWPEAGQALGLSRNATYDAARRGEIPTIKFGKLIKVPTAALRKMLENAGQSPNGPHSH